MLQCANQGGRLRVVGGPGIPACPEDEPVHCLVYRYMRAVDIQLAPDEAHVGAEIRVIGNDSGEKVRRPWLLFGGVQRLCQGWVVRIFGGRGCP